MNTKTTPETKCETEGKVLVISIPLDGLSDGSFSVIDCSQAEGVQTVDAKMLPGRLAKQFVDAVVGQSTGLVEDPIAALLSAFDAVESRHPYAYFELARTRTTDWMVHVYTHTDASRRERLALAQELTAQRACASAVERLRAEGLAPVTEIQWGVDRISAERQRQIWRLGYDRHTDDVYENSELALAAMAYLKHAIGYFTPGEIGDSWPWHSTSFKPGGKLRALEKAGAFIAAEIDRLIRFEAKINAEKGGQS